MQQEQSPMFEFDSLRMYLGDDYYINDKIVLHQPTIDEIASWGEKRYYAMVNTLCSIPSDCKSALFDSGVDWEEISDFDFFISICRNYPKSETEIIFGDLDFSNMQIVFNTDIEQHVLYDYDQDIQIDMYLYQKIIDYIRKMHSIVPCIEHAFNKRTKIALIELERQELTSQKNKKTDSILLPLISSMVNSPGFKYDVEGLRKIKLVQFMDSVQRIPVIMSADALMKGIYSGMVDVKKIDKKEFNWMREIKPEAKKGENLRIPNQKK